MARNTTQGASRWLVAGILVAALAGCDKASQENAGAGATKQGEKGAAAAADDELRRFNAAVKALNQISSHAFAGARSYARTFDAKRGPTGKESSPRVDSLDHRWTQEAVDGLRKAIAGRPPKDALDEASAAYVAALERLVPLTATASRYYEQQDWRDDKFAKGRELHPQLVEAYAGFEASYKALSAEVRRIEDSRRESRLAKLKASGQIIRHDIDVNLHQARTVLEFVEAQLEKTKRPQDMDLDGLKQRIDAFDATLTELRKVAGKGTGSEQAQKEFSYRAHNVDSYLNYADRFLLSAKDVLRAGRERKPMPTVYHANESGLTGNYNQMVGAFNGLNQN